MSLDRRVIAMDAEPNGWHYSTDNRCNRVLSFDDFLAGNLPASWKNCLLVVEDCHFRPAISESKAQVYTQPELDAIEAILVKLGIEVRLASGLHTSVLRRAAAAGTIKNGKADKQQDSVALLRDAQQNGYQQMKKWPPVAQQWDSSERHEQMLFRQNRMRSLRVGRAAGEADRERMLTAWRGICDRAWENDDVYDAVSYLSDGERDENKKRGTKHVAGRQAREPRPIVESVWVAMTNEDGTLYTVDGKFIGVRPVMERILRLHNYGRGIGRSQWMHYTLKVDEKRAFGKYDALDDPHREERRVLRREGQRHLRRIIAAFRDHLDATAIPRLV